VSGITFDAGGLIALDRNDRRVIALIARDRARLPYYNSGDRAGTSGS